MAFDSLRGRTVLQGGFSFILNGDLTDTWEWDGASWLQRSPANFPPARANQAMVYDAARGCMVLFGGRWGWGDTWTYDGVDWTDVTPPNGPSPRITKMAYDAARQRVVMFGGADGSATFADTWLWDGSNWSLQNPVSSPNGRTGHAMAYDSIRQRVVMWGGWGGGQETWEWDGSNWLQINSPTAPPWRNDHNMIFDGARGRVVLFGGSNYNGLQSDTWEWDGVDWTQVITLGSPTPRVWHGMAFDSGSRRVVLFGGNDGISSTGDTWEYFVASPAGFHSFGVGCAGAGGTPILAAGQGSLPVLGTTFTARLSSFGSNPFTNIPVMLLGESNTQWGGRSLPLSLSFIGMPNCTLYANPLISTNLLNLGGSATWSIAIPSSASLAGLTLYVQGLVGSPGTNALGLVVSNAGSMVLGW